MANYPIYDLTGKTPATTYINLVQYNHQSSSLVDGEGYELPQLNISGTAAINQPSGGWTPSYALDVNDAVGMSTYGNKNYIQFDDGNANMFFNAGVSGITYIALSPSITASSFGHNLTPTTPNTIVIGNGQHVGINQSTPSYSLDVSGSINFTNNFLKNGLPYTSSYSLTASYINNVVGPGVFETYVHATYLVTPSVGIQPELPTGYNVLLTAPATGSRGIYTVNADNSLSLSVDFDNPAYNGSIVWSYLSQDSDNGVQTGPYTYGVYYTEFCSLVTLSPLNSNSNTASYFLNSSSSID